MDAAQDHLLSPYVNDIHHDFHHIEVDHSFHGYIDHFEVLVDVVERKPDLHVAQVLGGHLMATSLALLAVVLLYQIVMSNFKKSN